MHKKDLWLRLRNYQFDHIVNPGIWDHLTARFGKTSPSEKAFAGKIARKHGWKMPFAARALQEYKKFLFLGVTADFLVTPSKIIDIVWHEHLLFSKAYRDFCSEIIEQPFDHYPELLPVEEQTVRYNAQYIETTALYRKEFGLEPPEDIWGNTKFDKEKLKKDTKEKPRKKSDSAIIDSSGFSDAPLYTHFETASAAAYPEFTGFEGGEFGGGGGSSDWGDSSGDSGGDSGGGDGGGCSGGCGGGGD